MTKRVKAGLVLILASLLYAASGRFYTRAILHLGEWSEHVEEYKGAHVCDRELYISFLATADHQALIEPYASLPLLARILCRLGACVFKYHQPRFAEVPLDALDWNVVPPAPNDPVPGPSMRKAAPRLGEGPVPIEVARCDKALPVAHLGNFGRRHESFFANDLTEPLMRDGLVVVGSDHAVAVFRSTSRGDEWVLEWALVGTPGWPRYTSSYRPESHRYRSWWSYPAVALALGPAVVMDVITAPIAILFRNVRY